MPAIAKQLADVVAQTREIVDSVIWCTVSTVDSTNSPRSRLMHPVWFWESDTSETSTPVGLVTARTTPLKVRHLAANPTVACFYWDPNHHTVAIDAAAEWLDSDARAEAWAAIAAVPEPVGFDPAMIWPDGPNSHGCGIIRLSPFRIVTTPAGDQASMWSRPEPGPAGAPPNDR